MISPHIKFNGNCKEAMVFYKSCLGGDLYMRKYAESPMACLLSSEVAMKISYASLGDGTFAIHASDAIGQQSALQGNAISILIDCKSETHLRTVFDRLIEAGEVLLPVHQTYWGSTRAELKDKFGVLWILNFVMNKRLNSTN